MGQMIPNSFTSYIMTEQEALTASSFTNLQIQYLQNLLSVAAEEKLRLKFDHNDPTEYAKQVAYKQAEIDTYTYLIEASAASQNMIQTNDNQQD